MTGAISTNFDFLAVHDAQLVRLAAHAERYFADDPNTSLIKLRQFGELLARGLLMTLKSMCEIHCADNFSDGRVAIVEMREGMP